MTLTLEKEVVVRVVEQPHDIYALLAIMADAPSTPPDSRRANSNPGITHKEEGTVYNKKSDLT